MKCSSCGAKTWFSHGAGSAVLCEKCFVKKNDNSEDAFAHSEGIQNKPESSSINSEEIPNKPEWTPIVFGEDSGDYKSSVLIAKFISFVGWFVCIIAILIVFVALSTVGKMGIVSLGPSLGILIGGLLLVVAGQGARALFNNANYSRQMLELMKKKDSQL